MKNYRFNIGDWFMYAPFFGINKNHIKVTGRTNDQLTVKESWISEDTGEMVSEENQYKILNKEVHDGCTSEYIVMWEYYDAQCRVYAYERDFKASLVVKEGADETAVPWVNPVTHTSHISIGQLWDNADNCEVLEQDGINNLVVVIMPEKWHIAQVSGYTADRGLYTETY